MSLELMIDPKSKESIERAFTSLTVNTSRRGEFCATMWYDLDDGTIYSFGSSRPPELRGKQGISSVSVLMAGEYGMGGPTENLDPHYQRIQHNPLENNHGLAKALEYIKLYNEERKKNRA